MIGVRDGLLLWILALVCALAHGKVQCPSLFLQEGAPGTYYALVFLDTASEQERDRLMSQVTPLLSDIARKLGDRAGTKKRLRVELIACEHHVGNADFAIEEMRDFLNYKVVAVFWKGQEGDKLGLVQLAVPVYLRSDSASRREVEVVTLYASKATNPVDSWIEVFGQDPSIYGPFVEMGLATVYQRNNEYMPAWVALCKSRTGLASLAQSALRPKREAFDSEIAAQIVVMMKDLEISARKAGVTSLPPCGGPVPAPAR